MKNTNKCIGTCDCCMHPNCKDRTEPYDIIGYELTEERIKEEIKALE